MCDAFSEILCAVLKTSRQNNNIADGFQQHIVTRQHFAELIRYIIGWNIREEFCPFSERIYENLLGGFRHFIDAGHFMCFCGVF